MPPSVQYVTVVGIPARAARLDAAGDALPQAVTAALAAASTTNARKLIPVLAQRTDVIVALRVPPGELKVTSSPTVRPINAAPSGDTMEILPPATSASTGPTMV